MKRFILSLILLSATLTVAATESKFPMSWLTRDKPTWENQPDVVLDIKWHRTSGFSFVENGVCHLVMQDDYVGVKAGESGLRLCMAKGAAKDKDAPTIAGTHRVRIWFATYDNLMPKRNDMYGPREITKPGRVASTHGMREGEYCVIVLVPGHDFFGHEYKHCEDGLFHANDPVTGDTIWLEFKEKS